MKTPEEWADDVMIGAGFGPILFDRQAVTKLIRDVQQDAREDLLTPPGELRLSQVDVDRLREWWAWADRVRLDRIPFNVMDMVTGAIHDLEQLRKLLHDVAQDGRA